MAIADSADKAVEPIVNDMIIENYQKLPPWREKFIRWKTLHKTCPAVAGPGGFYCLYGGHNCSYALCIFRVFEEEKIAPEKIPLPPVPQKISVRLDQMQKQIDEIIQKQTLQTVPQAP